MIVAPLRMSQITITFQTALFHFHSEVLDFLKAHHLIDQPGRKFVAGRYNFRNTIQQFYSNILKSIYAPLYESSSSIEQNRILGICTRPTLFLIR